MKKILYIVMMAAVLLFVACEKEHVRHYTTTPAADLAGVYNGTWSQIDPDSNVISGEGFISFEEVEPNKAIMILSCASPAIDKRTYVNVAHAEDDVVYYNNSEALDTIDGVVWGLGVAVQGRVRNNATSINYKVTEGKGRKAKTNKYYFTGSK